MTNTEAEAMWVPGLDISSWSELKYARALQHLASLNARLQVWGAGARVTTRKVTADDRKSVDVFVDVPRLPPLNELALDVGDALHNLRAALDAVTWELAHLDGTAPDKPQDIAFPICANAASWDRVQGRNLANVPAVAVERIASIQPFNGPKGGLSALEVLHKADIRDKHRSQLACRFIVSEINLDGGVFHFDNEDTIPDPPFEIRGYVEADQDGLGIVNDGMKLLSLRSSAAFETVDLPIALNIQLTIETDTGVHEVSALLDAVVSQTRMALDIIYRGPGGAIRRGAIESVDPT